MASTDVLKNEQKLEMNSFNSSEVLTGLPALAQLVQTLIITEPGTYPGNPYLGVGIEQYEFEFLDNSTLSSIKEKIESQIKSYIPTIYVDSIIVEKIKNAYGKMNTLGIMIKIRDSKNSSKSFVILIGKETTTTSSKTVSTIVI